MKMWKIFYLKTIIKFPTFLKIKNMNIRQLSVKVATVGHSRLKMCCFCVRYVVWRVETQGDVIHFVNFGSVSVFKNRKRTEVEVKPEISIYVASLKTELVSYK